MITPPRFLTINLSLAVTGAEIKKAVKRMSQEFGREFREEPIGFNDAGLIVGVGMDAHVGFLIGTDEVATNFGLDDNTHYERLYMVHYAWPITKQSPTHDVKPIHEVMLGYRHEFFKAVAWVLAQPRKGRVLFEGRTYEVETPRSAGNLLVRLPGEPHKTLIVRSWWKEDDDLLVADKVDPMTKNSRLEDHEIVDLGGVIAKLVPS